MRFLGIVLRGLRLEVSVCNVYITNQFKATFAMCISGMKTFVPITSKNSVSGVVKKGRKEGEEKKERKISPRGGEVGRWAKKGTRRKRKGNKLQKIK